MDLLKKLFTAAVEVVVAPTSDLVEPKVVVHVGVVGLGIGGEANVVVAISPAGGGGAEGELAGPDEAGPVEAAVGVVIDLGGKSAVDLSVLGRRGGREEARVGIAGAGVVGGGPDGVVEG